LLALALTSWLSLEAAVVALTVEAVVEPEDIEHLTAQAAAADLPNRNLG